jgi:hypothetical protein
MHLRFSLTSLIFLCAAVGAVTQSSPAAPTCADLHLVPAVRECTAVAVLPIGDSGLVIPNQEDPENDFVVKDLAEASVRARNGQ